MKNKKKHTLSLSNLPIIAGGFSIVGPKEGEGPLNKFFDVVLEESIFGESTWEKAESKLIRTAVDGAVSKVGLSHTDVDFILAGDLLNQCASSSFGLRGFNVPFIGLYGACSTMAESIMLSSLLVDGGYGENIVATTSSHFCSAERQFRFPLEYGGTRPETSQWTVTGSGAVVISAKGNGPKIKRVTPGKIVDYGVKDANNMGAAMAPAAADTIISFLEDTKEDIKSYDMILTGDLGKIGSQLLMDIFLLLL